MLRRKENAEKEIVLQRELFEASWSWIEAHLNYCAAVWDERLHERGKGEISLWTDLCILRKERDELQKEGNTQVTQ